MLLMASVGYIYTQAMVEESHAKHGPFYVTNTLEMSHPDISVSLFTSVNNLTSINHYFNFFLLHKINFF